MQNLGHRIKPSFQGGRQCRAVEAGAAVESLITSDLSLVKDVWIQMWGWYKDADYPPPLRQGNHQVNDGREGGTLLPCPSYGQSHTHGGHPLPRERLNSRGGG